MYADVPPPPVGSIGPWGEGELKTQKMGVVSFVHRTATISIFLSVAKCGSICRAQTCAHSGVEPSRSANAFLHCGPKSSKRFRFFNHFEILRPYIEKLLKIEAYKQRREKKLYLSPIQLSHVFGPIGHGFYRVSQKVSDVIPVLRLTPIATQPSAVSVFLSVVLRAIHFRIFDHF